MSSSQSSASLPQHLEQLAIVLSMRAPQSPDGSPAHLVGLMPAEPVVGEVAVACWVAGDDAEQFDLVRLEDGEPIHDQTAMRETLALLAMTETLEELASFAQLGPLHDELQTWRHRVDAEHQLARDLERAASALERLHELAPPEHGRVARTQILDDIGMRLRELERCWEHLEQSAELWSDEQLAAAPTSEVRDERLTSVQELWRVLGGGRRGPLATPAATAVHAGREAGVAFAAAIAEAARAV